MRAVHWSPGRDFFVALVGAVLLLGATGGMFYMDQRPSDQTEVSWLDVHVFDDERDGSMEEGDEPFSHPFVLGEAASHERLVVDRVTFGLEWDEPSTDRFRLTVTAPNGTIETKDSDDGRVDMELQILLTPEIIRPYQDITAQEVWDEFDPEVRTAGKGRWYVTVELLEAPREFVEGVEDPTQTKENGFLLGIDAWGWLPMTIGHPSFEMDRLELEEN